MDNTINTIEEATRLAKQIEEVENPELKEALNRALMKLLSTNGTKPNPVLNHAKSRDRMFNTKPGSNRYIVLDTINRCATHSDPLSCSDIHDLISDQLQLSQVHQACASLFAAGALNRIQSIDKTGNGSDMPIFKYYPRDIK